MAKRAVRILKDKKMSNLQTINSNEMTFTNEQKQIIRRQFFPPTASDSDMIYCMEVAKAFKLNPILKQIYFVERRAKINNQWVCKVEPLAGRDSFLTLAHRSGEFAGIESETMIKEKPFFNGKEWRSRPELVAVAKVFKKDCDKPFIVEVNYSEYAQKTSQGEITKFWREMPETMLKKVAESQALRKAFDITGLYSIDERNDMIQTEPIRQNRDEVSDLNATDAEVICEYDEQPNLSQTEQKISSSEIPNSLEAEAKQPNKREPQTIENAKDSLKQLLMQKGLNEYEAIDFMAKHAYTPVLAKQFLDNGEKLKNALDKFFENEINL